MANNLFKLQSLKSKPPTWWAITSLGIGAMLQICCHTCRASSSHRSCFLRSSKAMDVGKGWQRGELGAPYERWGWELQAQWAIKAISLQGTTHWPAHWTPLWSSDFNVQGRTAMRKKNSTLPSCKSLFLTCRKPSIWKLQGQGPPNPFDVLHPLPLKSS